MVRQSQFCFSNGIEGVIVAIEARIYIYIHIFLHSQCPGFISSLYRPFFSCSPYPWYPGVKWSELKWTINYVYYDQKFDCIPIYRGMVINPFSYRYVCIYIHIYIYKPIIFNGFSWKGDYQKPTRQSCGTFATSRLYGRIAQKRVAWSNVRCWDVVFFSLSLKR